jgi:hypothetical protein
VPERCHESNVRVRRVNGDAADVVRVGQSAVPPRLAAVGRAVNAAAPGNRVPRIGLAGADVHDVRFPLTHRDGADALGRLLWVGWSSKTGWNVSPASVVFHTPPLAAAT